MFDFIEELELAIDDLLAGIVSLTNYLTFKVDELSANIEFMAGILKYAPYIIIALGIIIVIQMFFLFSMKYQIDKIERKIDKIIAAPIENKESKNGEDAQ